MSTTTITLVNFVLFGFLILTAFSIVRTSNLFAVAMLSSVFSLLSAGLFLVLDAVDVSFTEAAVGAGVSTVLILGTMALTRRTEIKPSGANYPALLAVIGTGAVLIYGTLDLPPFGASDTPVHLHLAPDYIDRMPAEMGFPNIVTAILASYRGFDTLGEVVVVFTAAVAVLLLLLEGGKLARDSRSHDEEDS